MSYYTHIKIDRGLKKSKEVVKKEESKEVETVFKEWVMTICLVGWFLNVLVNFYVISLTGPKTERLTMLRAVTHETELGDHDFCLSRSHYTDTDLTSRERAATAGIEPGTSPEREIERERERDRDRDRGKRVEEEGDGE